jgi:hypothetical protein
VTDPYAAPAWAVPVAAAPSRINWRAEALVALVVTAYSTLLGAVVGVVWPRVAPHLDVQAAVQFSEPAPHALFSDDLMLGVLGVAAGVLAVLILTVFGGAAGRGPGGMIGLAAGGMLGSLVAMTVGEAARAHVNDQLFAAFHHLYPTVAAGTLRQYAGYFDFSVRAKAVLIAWPLAAVILHAAVIVTRSIRHSE